MLSQEFDLVMDARCGYRFLKCSLLFVAAIVVTGCDVSSRTINYEKDVMQVGNPIALPPDSWPVGASPDGTRLALLKGNLSQSTDKMPETMTLSVIDTATKRELGLRMFHPAAKHPLPELIFSKDGTRVYFRDRVAQFVWDYASNEVKRLGPGILETGLPDVCLSANWNYDRTIGVGDWRQDESLSAKELAKQAAPRMGALTCDGVVHEFPSRSFGGFDPDGRAWFKVTGSWIVLNRRAEVSTAKSRPIFLAKGQTADRGSKHLTTTELQGEFKDGRAEVSCVWLSDDRSVPFKEVPGVRSTFVRPLQTALLFAGPDVIYDGFLPGQDEVVVVSARGSYLVPFTKSPK